MQVSRQGDILVVTVVERPAIAKIAIDGNKDIKNEDLLKGLKEIGLAEGETFDRLQLDRLTQELTRQYNNRGKYNVSIKPTVTELDRNRVEIHDPDRRGQGLRRSSTSTWSATPRSPTRRSARTSSPTPPAG